MTMRYVAKTIETQFEARMFAAFETAHRLVEFTDCDIWVRGASFSDSRGKWYASLAVYKPGSDPSGYPDANAFISFDSSCGDLKIEKLIQ